MASAPGITINLPGAPFNNLPEYGSIAALRAVLSSGINPNDEAIITPAGVGSQSGIFIFSAASLVAEDGINVLKPNDLTPLQAGRWLSTLFLKVGGPAGPVGGNVMSVGPFTAVSTMSGTALAGTNLIQTSSFGTTVAKGAGLYRRWNAIDTTMPVLTARGQGVWWQQDADGGRWYLDGNNFSVEQLGALGSMTPINGVLVDDGPAINRAVNEVAADRAAPTVPGYSARYRNGPTIRLDSFDYYASTIIMKAAVVRLFGVGNGDFQDAFGSVIVTPVAQHGIITLGQYGTPTGSSTATTGCDGSLVKGITFRSSGDGTVEVYGNWKRAKVTFENCRFQFYMDGWHEFVTAQDPSVNSVTQGNTNVTAAYNCSCAYNSRDGWSIQGADPNANDYFHIAALANGRTGFRDNSFLGGNVFGLHEELNGVQGSGHPAKPRTQDPYVRYQGGVYYPTAGYEAQCSTDAPGTSQAWTYILDQAGADTWVSGTVYIGGGAAAIINPNSATVIHGHYSEGGQTPAQKRGRGFSIGGLQGAGNAMSGNGNLASGHMYRSQQIIVTTGIGTQEDAKSRSTATLLGGDPASGLISTKIDTKAGTSIIERGDGLGNIITTVAGGNNGLYFMMTGSLTTLTFGRTTAQPGAIVFPEWFLGMGNAARSMTSTGVIPASGYHAVGEIAFNNAPTAGGNVGWICVTAGTPGTWKTWGAIAA